MSKRQWHQYHWLAEQLERIEALLQAGDVETAKRAVINALVQARTYRAAELEL